MVNNAVNGFNNTLFVYGQTGTGKTYTMSGNKYGGKKGVIQKTFELLREKINNSSTIENSTIKMSYYEIYNEKVRDLMNGNYQNVR